MDNILIAYFMRKGHAASTSKRVADDIATALFEKEYTSVEYAITPIESYPEDKNQFEAVAEAEKKNHFRPALTGKAGRFNDYGTIVIVTPNWFGDLPMGVYSFLDDYDFGGKTVFPVICHGGDGASKIVENLRKYLPMADVLDGIDIPDSAEDDKLVKKAAEMIIKKK